LAERRFGVVAETGKSVSYGQPFAGQKAQTDGPDEVRRAEAEVVMLKAS
jgi:hypothetical protein